MDIQTAESARHMQVTVVKNSEGEVDQDTVERAVQTLNDGGLVVFPTETVYGIAASAANPKGFAALQAFKGRPDHHPFTIHLPDPTSVPRYANATHPDLQRLVKKVFPGPVTLVMQVPDSVIDDKLQALALPPEARHRLYHQNTVGLRCPDSWITRHVLERVQAPVVASSANARGQAPPHNAAEAAQAVGDAAELIIDAGPCRYAKPSTIVRVDQTNGTLNISVDREGVLDERVIRKLMRYTILMVCTGNTCRSPMAQAMAQQIIAQQRNISIDDLNAADVYVLSAGIYAATEAPASPEAVAQMNQRGLDLSHHRSQPLTPEVVHEADVIYCMTHAHRQALVQMVPSAAEKTLPLDPQGDIDDPIGSDAAAYQRCAQSIHHLLTERLKEFHP